MKRRIYNLFGLAAVSLFLLLSGCQSSDILVPDEPLPDLIIESVSWYQGHATPGMSYDGEKVEYTIRVKNVGDAPAEGWLYCQVSRDSEEYVENMYSSITLILDNGVIEPGETLIRTLQNTAIFDGETARVRFFVNPEYKNDPLPKPIPEKDRSNNTYEILMTKPLPVYLHKTPPPALARYSTDNESNLITDVFRIPENVMIGPSLALIHFPGQVARISENTTDDIVLKDNTLAVDLSKYPEYALVLDQRIMSCVDSVAHVIGIELKAGEFDPVISEEAALSCLGEASRYFYAFPGYKYYYAEAVIKVTAVSEQSVQVKLDIDTDGLYPDPSSDNKAKDDTYRFEFTYDRVGQTCTIDDGTIDVGELPEKIRQKALTLLEEAPVVSEFMSSEDDYSIRIYNWFDEQKEKYVYSPGDHVTYGFLYPVKGIIPFLIYSDDNNLHAYVDLFHGEVMTIGPAYSLPE